MHSQQRVLSLALHFPELVGVHNHLNKPPYQGHGKCRPSHGIALGVSPARSMQCEEQSELHQGALGQCSSTHLALENLYCSQTR